MRLASYYCSYYHGIEGADTIIAKESSNLKSECFSHQCHPISIRYERIILIHLCRSQLRNYSNDHKTANYSSTCAVNFVFTCL